jgi:hypothetical protein
MYKTRKGIELLEQIRQSKNVRATCQELGISRSQYYKLLQSPVPKPPKAYRPEKMGENTVRRILELALAYPLGCHHLQEQLQKEGIIISTVSIQKILNLNCLGTLKGRLSAIEKKCMEGQIVQFSMEQQEFLAQHNPALLEFTREIKAPGELISMFSFFLGQLPWLGKVYLYFALDAYSGYAQGLVAYAPDKYLSARFLKQNILPFYAEKEIPIRAIETSSDADFFSYAAHPFSSYLRSLPHVKHQRTTIGSIKTNGYCQLWGQYLQRWVVPELKKDKQKYLNLENLDEALQFHLDVYNRAAEPKMVEHFQRYPFLGHSPLSRLTKAK